MNAFFDHHQHSIRLSYRCFDRLLLNGLIQPFQQPERVIGFFNAYREGKRVTTRSSARDCRSIQELGDEPFTEVERADSGGAGGST
jgi:hypothetical protein